MDAITDSLNSIKRLEELIPGATKWSEVVCEIERLRAELDKAKAREDALRECIREKERLELEALQEADELRAERDALREKVSGEIESVESVALTYGMLCNGPELFINVCADCARALEDGNGRV